MLCVHLNPQQDMDISNILATDKMTADRCLYLYYLWCQVLHRDRLQMEEATSSSVLLVQNSVQIRCRYWT